MINCVGEHTCDKVKQVLAWLRSLHDNDEWVMALKAVKEFHHPTNTTHFSQQAHLKGNLSTIDLKCSKKSRDNWKVLHNTTTFVICSPTPRENGFRSYSHFWWLSLVPLERCGSEFRFCETSSLSPDFQRVIFFMFYFLAFFLVCRSLIWMSRPKLDQKTYQFFSLWNLVFVFLPNFCVFWMKTRVPTTKTFYKTVRQGIREKISVSSLFYYLKATKLLNVVVKCDKFILFYKKQGLGRVLSSWNAFQNVMSHLN